MKAICMHVGLQEGTTFRSCLWHEVVVGRILIRASEDHIDGLTLIDRSTGYAVKNVCCAPRIAHPAGMISIARTRRLSIYVGALYTDVVISMY
jgi:hypothetical protein